MSRISDLVNDPEDPFGRQPVEAIVVAEPDDGLITVRILAFATDDVDRVRFMPRGDEKPSIGDYCLIVFTSDGTAWCPAWQPTGSEIEPPPPTQDTTDDGDDGATATGTAWMP
jgi:hypothetical protein